MLFVVFWMAWCELTRSSMEGMSSSTLRDRELDHCIREWFFIRRVVTTSRPIITRSLWTEVSSQYLFETIDKALTYDIPDESIINVDQTPSKFVATENVKCLLKGRNMLVQLISHYCYTCRNVRRGNSSFPAHLHRENKTIVTECQISQRFLPCIQSKLLEQ